ncbi:MAG: hypothetical protein ACYTFW_07455 [Planctomycetota bacterium]
MVKKTLFAIALALLVTTANAGIVVTNLEGGPPGDVDSASVKVEGSEKWQKTFNWPYWVDWGYHAQDICTIPVKMEVGMYIEIIDCNRKEIVLKQVSCGDLKSGAQSADKYPCYEKCITVDAVSNFDAQLGLSRNTTSPILDHDKWKAYFDGGDTVPKDGNVHTLTICVEAWQAKIYKHEPGSKVDVGEVTITVKPQ